MAAVIHHRLDHPYHGVALPHWTYETTQEYPGRGFMDLFCVKRRYHVMLSLDLGGWKGWHLSVRPFCSDPGQVNPTAKVRRSVWMRDVHQLDQTLGIRLRATGQSRVPVFHFHQEGHAG